MTLGRAISIAQIKASEGYRGPWVLVELHMLDSDQPGRQGLEPTYWLTASKEPGDMMRTAIGAQSGHIEMAYEHDDDSSDSSSSASSDTVDIT